MRRFAPLLVGALLVAGCATPPPAGPGASTPTAEAPQGHAAVADGASPTGEGRSVETPAPTTPTTRPAAPRITLAFAGDVHFARQLEPLVDDAARRWATRLPELARADFAMVNLETALTERGRPVAKKYTFRASPDALDALAAAGVDAVSMANNHAADYGRTGIEDTLAAIEDSPIPVVGFGKDEGAAYAPITVDVEGVRVGIVAATEVAEETYANHSAGRRKPGVAQNVDRDRFTRAAREAVASHDLVVAFMHWGLEGTTCPSERQVETARVLADAGVDVVVGTHAHRPQGSGWQGRTFVGYGLGNFIWYNSSPGSRSSGVLTLTVDAARARQGRRTGRSVVTDYAWTPKVITGAGLPVTVKDSGQAERLAAAATRCSELAQSPR